MNQETINQFSKWKLSAIAAGVAVVIAVATALIYIAMFGSPQKQAELQQFTVAIDLASTSDVAKSLEAKGFIKSSIGFKIAFSLSGGHEVQPGAYQLSKAMTAWEIAKTLEGEPSLKWVTIPEGLRKEEIADMLAETLKWDEQTKQKWISTYTALKYDYVEGVYFPDTYLIPINETPLQVAERMQAHFETVFAPYAKEALNQNIKWTTALTLASIVQREAAGKDDMPLIAGILWNRLEKGMPLEVDATIQYARGNTDKGWWSPIKVADKQIASAYNTYKNKGLPPHPIANPGTDAINAVLTPAETACIYYLHDGSKIIHCAKTFEEHQANIEKYLR